MVWVNGMESWGYRTYHGRVSSASTGRFAALLLPWLACLEENVTALSSRSTASTSIPSS